MITETGQPNIYTIVGGELAIEALGKRVIIVEDRFRTGYECSTCDGVGFFNEECPHCNGKTILTGIESFSTCPSCRIEGRSTGKKLCPTCKGRGGLLIAPQEAEGRPSSGKIMSIGPEVKILKVGDRVIYSNYAGTAINFKQKAVVRILQEEEIFGRLYGTGDLGG